MKDDKKKKQTPGKNVKRTAKPKKASPAAKKQTKTVKPVSKAQKPEAKKTTAKKAAPKAKQTIKNTSNKSRSKITKPENQIKSTSKKPSASAKKTNPKTVYPKHNDKEENKVGAERPIIINGKVKPPKQTSAAKPASSNVTQRAGRVSSITYHIKYD